MPTISVPRKILKEIKFPEMNFSEFEDLCFQFGLEAEEDSADPEILKVEVPANRIDLVSYDGILQALQVYIGLANPPMFYTKPPTSGTSITVTKETGSIRPFVFAGILRNINFTEENFATFIDLQDKLHQNIGRKRQLVAIGTHDLDTIQGPFTYDCQKPEDIKFAPLGQSEELTAPEIMEQFRSHAQLKQYLHIIEDKELYPVIRDSCGKVLSMPPIINGDLSKISLSTKNVFVEVTAESRVRGEIVLNTLLTTFSKYCSEFFTTEQVHVTYDGLHREMPGVSKQYPTFPTRDVSLSMKEVREVIGGDVAITSRQVGDFLKRMMISSTVSNEDHVVAHVPTIRSDILHSCDLAEDVAIALKFDNIPMTPFEMRPELKIRKLAESLRLLFAVSGYNEVLTFGLCSKKEAYSHLCRSETEPAPPQAKDTDVDIDLHRNSLLAFTPDCSPVVLANPKTTEFQIVRPSLFGGLLKSLFHNKSKKQPICLFEVGDVCVKSAHMTGSSNKLHAAALIASSDGSGLADIHGLLDEVLSRMGVEPVYAEVSDPKIRKHYRLEHITKKGGSDHPYLDGRCCQIILKQEKEEIVIGEMGTVHPTVLKSFGIALPCSVFEINVGWMLEGEGEELV